MEEDVVPIEEQLKDLIEEITTTGKQELNETDMKLLKKMCKTSDENVKTVYRLLISQLHKAHSEVRYSAFQVMNELFVRSHLFRQLTESELQNIFVLTVETDAINSALPPPLYAAKALKLLAIQTFEKWHEKYGKFYKKLNMGYTYLKNVKKINFDGVRSQAALERQRAEFKKRQEE